MTALAAASEARSRPPQVSMPHCHLPGQLERPPFRWVEAPVVLLLLERRSVCFATTFRDFQEAQLAAALYPAQPVFVVAEPCLVPAMARKTGLQLMRKSLPTPQSARTIASYRLPRFERSRCDRLWLYLGLGGYFLRRRFLWKYVGLRVGRECRELLEQCVHAGQLKHGCRFRRDST